MMTEPRLHRSGGLELNAAARRAARWKWRIIQWLEAFFAVAGTGLTAAGMRVHDSGTAAWQG